MMMSGASSRPGAHVEIGRQAAATTAHLNEKGPDRSGPSQIADLSEPYWPDGAGAPALGAAGASAPCGEVGWAGACLTFSPAFAAFGSETCGATGAAS